MREALADRAGADDLGSGEEPEMSESLALLLFEEDGHLFAVDADQVAGILDMGEAVRRGIHVFPLTFGMSGEVSAEISGGMAREMHCPESQIPGHRSAPGCDAAFAIERPSGGFRILVIREETPPKGIVVPSPREMISVPFSRIYPMPDLIGRLVPGHPVWALARIGDRKALLLDCYRLIAHSRPTIGRS